MRHILYFARNFDLPNRAPFNLGFYARSNAISGSRLIEHSASWHGSVPIQILLRELIGRYAKEGLRSDENCGRKGNGASMGNWMLAFEMLRVNSFISPVVEDACI